MVGRQAAEITKKQPRSGHGAVSPGRIAGRPPLLCAAKCNQARVDCARDDAPPSGDTAREESPRGQIVAKYNTLSAI